MNQIISQLLGLQQKPVPFTPGELLFWDEPHISTQMLDAHLNPDIDAACALSDMWATWTQRKGLSKRSRNGSLALDRFVNPSSVRHCDA